MFNRTKIICTIGPSVTSYEKMLALIDAGMNVARLNFSHGTHVEHAINIANLKKARKQARQPLALMLDTQGPEIRIGKVKDGAITLSSGQKLKLAASSGDVPFPYPEVLEIMRVGTKVLFDDGYIIGTVIDQQIGFAIVQIENSGVLKSGKKMNIPGVVIPIPAMTEKDVEDLKFGCREGIDFVAASFIRSSHHILAIKQLLAKEGSPHIQVIAKIESTQGVENFDSIVQAADGIMIARGDLGVEVDLAEVPKLQKRMIRKCFQACKPSITATQMLESMITNPRPTRAEASDVANAIYDYTSCIMLSGETAVGAYPIESTERMRSIARVAEEDVNYRKFFEEHSQRDYHDISSAVAAAAVKTAYGAGAKVIFAFTESGMTARLLSRLRPGMLIVAVTPSETTYNQLALNWGVVPLLLEGWKDAKEAFTAASAFAQEKGLISFGDVVVVTSGIPFGKKGTTNMMVVETIGDILVRGNKGHGPKVTGKVSLLLSPEGHKAEDFKGRIVVILHCDHTFLEILKNAAGVILQNYVGDTGSETYAEIVAKTFNISMMTRSDGAMQLLKEGEVVTLDPKKNLLYRGAD
jgi:pyruvate kinase